MDFWFVNQGRTYKHKGNEDYLWSPRRAEGGRVHQYYENMRRLKPGDVVLAFFAGGVQGYGVAQTYSYPYMRPLHYQRKWQGLGWRCDVWFTRFAREVPLRSHADELAAIPSPDQSVRPLDRNGQVHQGSYLSRVAPEFARTVAAAAGDAGLLDILRAGKAALPSGAALDTISYRHAILDAIQARRIEQSYDADDVRNLLQARHGVGMFREEVAKVEDACRLTNQLYSHSLTACHIKPWRESSDEEKLAGANGLLLAPGAAPLFSHGFFSFDDDGALVKSPLAANEPLLGRLLAAAGGRPKRFNAEQRVFLGHHREFVLLKPYRNAPPGQS